VRLALVITTYERPDALAAVLATVLAQREPADEIIVADDGSGTATHEVIEGFARRSPAPIIHARQTHEGFRLTRLRNLAVRHSTAEYLVFVDGDMLLHPSFVADHRNSARPGHFTQGVRVLLDEARTRAALLEPLAAIRPWSPGLGSLRRLYAVHAPRLASAVRRLANGVIALKGCNQGFWRDDLVAVNGFDEEIVGWGPEDKELCARLRHTGIRRQTLLFGGIAYHLAHPPAARDRHEANQRILEQTLASRRRRCERGLDDHHGRVVDPDPR
jgi:glycosyltransferase involved in cell wall biosynthesis